MLQLRPTFSESWYRVAPLKAKLRSGAQISRVFYRGERWYVVRDPAGNQFHRLSDAAYRFVGLLDGSRTVAEAWDLVGGQLADDAPTQPEVIQILSQLYSANLMEADITPDATVLLTRHKQLMKRQLQGRLMNVLFPRIPIWDPDSFLKRWMPVAKVFLSKFGMVLWLIVVIAAIAKIAPMGTQLKQAGTNMMDIGAHPENVFLLWVTFALVKFWHELGHAFMTRRFGGECHEMGIMFLVFIPTPYVDASTASAFRSRWQRMAVGAAGMIFELMLAGVLAFVWANTSDQMLINKLCFNAMVVASVTTIIFNANPLLRYDGYYMLSDFWEIPNLQQKSSEYLLGLIKRHVFRIKPRQPLPPPLQRVELFFYGIASTIYRIIVGITIILVVAWKVPILGILMALGGVVTWMVTPVVKLSRYLLLEPELHRKRGRAFAFSGAVAAAVVICVGLLRFPVHYRAEGYAEAMEQPIVHAGTSGFVSEIRQADGAMLKKGDVIFILRDLDADLQVAQLTEEMNKLKLQVNQTRAEDANLYQSVQAKIRATTKQLNNAIERHDQLIVRSPIDGKLVAPKITELMGRYVPRGQELAMVQTMDDLMIKVVLDQSDAQLQILPNVKEVEVRMAGAVTDAPLKSTSVNLIPAAQKELPHPSLGSTGGGDVATNPRDPKKPMVEQFELWVRVPNPPGAYHGQSQFYPGQRAYLRFTLADNKPLYWQWVRKLMQLIEVQGAKSKWM